MLVQWKDDLYSVGIPVLDVQHKELFSMANRLNDLLQNKDALPVEVVEQKAVGILKDLYSYSSYHFLSEEELFKEYSYPETAEHVDVHKHFREVMKNYLEDIRQKKDLSLEYLQDFLVNWIIDHIQGDDGKYKNFFAEKKLIPVVEISDKELKRSLDSSEWEAKKLSLEVIEIDNQHKELVRILQQTNDLQKTSESRKKIFIPVIIQKLLYYTQYHFGFEEEHMAKNNFPDLEDHRKEHNKFIDDVNSFIAEYEKGSADLTDKIILFLKEWTVDHILKDDNDYKKYLDKSGIISSA